MQSITSTILLLLLPVFLLAQVSVQNGNVGVGVSNPIQKLEIDGTTWVSLTTN